jgi:hypothetical protein
MKEGLRHTEAGGRLPQGQVSHGADLLVGYASSWTAQALALCLRPRHPKSHFLGYSRPLELRNRPQDVELETTCRGAGVDALSKAHKADAESREFVEQHDQVSQVAPESIQPPHYQRVEPLRLAAFTSSSSAGRDSRAPLTPLSTNSVVCQPRASV